MKINTANYFWDITDQLITIADNKKIVQLPRKNTKPTKIESRSCFRDNL